MRKRAPMHLKRDSLILQNPIELEESIPIDSYNALTRSKRSFNLTTSIKKLTSWYIRSNAMRAIVSIASLISCALFVIDSYDKFKSSTSQTAMDIIDIIIFFIFALDYVFNILNETSKVSYIWSFKGLVDLASLCSIINIFAVNADLSFLPLLRLLRNFKLLRMFQLSMYINIDDPQPLSPSEAILFETVSLAGGIIIAWFLTASILFSIIQQDADAFTYNSDASFNIQSDITLFDCIYIILVLISTLGFGDFSPNNFYGRLFVIVVMILTLTIIPAQVGQLVERMGKNNAKYMNEYHAKVDKPHIIICGQFDIKSVQQLVSLVRAKCSTAFSDSSTTGTDIFLDETTPPIVLLSSIYPSAPLELLLVHPVNAKKVHFFVGSVKSTRDLSRVKASRAMAVIILEDSDSALFGDLEMGNTDAVQTQDFNTKLKVVSCINFLLKELSSASKVTKMSIGKDSRVQYQRQDTRRETGSSALVSRPVVVAQSTSLDACSSLLNYGADRMVEVNSLKYSVLAYGALFPGFIALLHALVLPPDKLSVSKEGGLFSRKKRRAALSRVSALLRCGKSDTSSGQAADSDGVEGSSWLDDMHRSRSFGIQEIAVSVVMSDEIKRLSFSQLCKFLYRWSAGTIVCVGVYGWRDEEHALINPERRVTIADCRSVFFVCNNLEVLLAMLQTNSVGSVAQKLFESAAVFSADSSDIQSPPTPASPASMERGESFSMTPESSLRGPGVSWNSWRVFHSENEVRQFEELCVAEGLLKTDKDARLLHGLSRENSGLNDPSERAIDRAAADSSTPSDSHTEVTLELPNSTKHFLPKNDPTTSSSSTGDMSVLMDTKRQSPSKVEADDKVNQEIVAPSLTETSSSLVSERFEFRRDISSLRKENIDTAMRAEPNTSAISSLLSSYVDALEEASDEPSNEPSNVTPIIPTSRHLASSVDNLDIFFDEDEEEEEKRIVSVAGDVQVYRGSTATTDRGARPRHPSLVDQSSVISLPSGRNLLAIPEPDGSFSGTQTARSGPTRTRNYRAPRRFKDHVVLVCAFSPTFPTAKIALAVQIFVAATRSRADDLIVVLASNSSEVQKQVEGALGRPEDNVRYVDGVPYSASALKAVDACHARCVVILGNSHEPSASDMDQSITSSELDLHSDLYIILTTLELDAMIKVFLKRRGSKQARDRLLTSSGVRNRRRGDLLPHMAIRGRDSVGSDDNADDFIPVVIQEVYNASSVSFLSDNISISRESADIWNSSFFNTSFSLPSTTTSFRENSYHRTESRASGVTKAKRSMSADNAYILLRNSLSTQGDVSDESAAPETRARVTAEAEGVSGNSSVSPVSALAQGRVYTQHIVDALTIDLLFNPNIVEFWQNLLGMRRPSATTDPSSPLFIPQGQLDKLAIPPTFTGRTFGDLFRVLLMSYGTVALGLYRKPSGSLSNSSSESHYVCVLPSPETPVSSSDHVFVLLRGNY